MTPVVCFQVPSGYLSPSIKMRGLLKKNDNLLLKGIVRNEQK